MKVIQATLRELDLVVPLLDAYRQFYAQTSDAAGARAFLAERLRNAESVVLIALDEHGEGSPALGFVQLYPSFSSVSMRRLWILNDLFIVPAARQRGVARRLMDQARRLAEETGAKGLVLSTAKDNARAKGLYEALGYTLDRFDHYELIVDRVVV